MASVPSFHRATVVTDRRRLLPRAWGALPAVLAVVVCPVLAATPAQARGQSVVSFTVAADAGSAPAAARVGRIADEVWAHDDQLTPLVLEAALEGGAPVWEEKHSEAMSAFARGRQAMEAVDLAVAADAFAEGIVAFEQAIPGVTDLAPLVDALVQQGSVLVLQGEGEGGRERFLRALALDPAASVSAEGVPPRVTAAFDAARKKSRALGQGAVTVSASQRAAEAWIDGVFRGITPLTVELDAGRHYVRVVKDGYLAWGSAVDVKRGADASVQASLRPTRRLAELETLATRIARDKDSPRPAAELAAALKVDRLLSIVVEDRNGSALVSAQLVDGVSGRSLAQGSRVFAIEGEFFERDVRGFLEDLRRQGANAPRGAPPSLAGPSIDGQPSLLPGPPAVVETPGTVIGGWVLIGLATALAVNTVVCGIISADLQEQYRGTTQLEPDLEPLRATWLTMALVTDASWVFGSIAAVTGSSLLVAGYGEMAAQQELVGP